MSNPPGSPPVTSQPHESKWRFAEPYDWGIGSHGVAISQSFFALVVGADTGRTQTDNTVVWTVKDPNGTVIDSATNGFTTSGQAVEGLSRVALVPPGGTFNIPLNTSGRFSYVLCQSLTAAMAALLGLQLGR